MIQMDTESTRVVFRVCKDTNTVIALMPDIEAQPGYCSSYEHVGQHGAADYSGVLRKTRKAEQHEEIPLLLELKSIGYNVQVITRFTPHRKAPME